MTPVDVQMLIYKTPTLLSGKQPEKLVGKEA
jgi:hypothetical protein